MAARTLLYYSSEHPTVVGFRWSHAQSWGATWSFLFTSISFYIALSVTIHVLLLLLLRHRRPIPLGPLPTFHSLAMSLLSAAIFVGTLASSAAEIRDTRWLWARTKTTPVQWLLCFPIGTRPSGRVFFWSYVFYLSRFLHAFRTLITVLRRRSLSFFELFNHSVPILMSFLWLEFSQSFQVLEILFTSLTFAVVYGYRFWTEMGFRRASFPLVVNCQIALLGCNVICHFGVLYLQFWKGGCNGIGAWIFNSVLNFGFLLMFLNTYMKIHWIHKNAVDPPTKGKSI